MEKRIFTSSTDLRTYLTSKGFIIYDTNSKMRWSTMPSTTSAYWTIDANGDFNFNTGKAIEKLYSNGASLKWNGYNFIPEYYNDRDTFSQFIKYKDLGKSQYNYDSEYYKKYQGYIDVNGEIYHCHDAQNDCKYVYKEPETDNTNKELYNRWISSLILACFTLVCNLVLGIFGFFIFTNICNF